VTASHPGSRKDGRGGEPPAGGAGLLDAKFAIPMVTHLVPRPRLHSRLTGGLENSCTLIAAPAGWGKTLLAGSWLAEAGAGRAAAWISLGPAEDDVRAFWTAVATAVAPIVGDRAASALQRIVVEDDVERLPGQFAALLAEDGAPVVLVLDNLHEITSLVVHESLLRLIQRQTVPIWATSSSGPRGGPPGCGWPHSRSRVPRTRPNSSTCSPATTTRWRPTCLAR
jgi:LuxR family transcriptional regulator, maltose regulon positive regulatory protein